MGYTTDFNGSLSFNKPIEEWLINYLDKFNKTRRMKRDNEKIIEVFPNWEELCLNGNLGTEGEFFVGGLGYYGQNHDPSVLEGNDPACTQPGLWCQWIIDDDGNLAWDGGEKFYEYEEWLKYLIDKIFAPLGYVLNGNIEWQGEEYDDFGYIEVVDNEVTMHYGIRITSMGCLSAESMIEELERRGYVVSKHA